ncbi:hypothetical protein MFMK1_000974 [Metallumcola ferriviriculae]|uniref:Uncharacterized protein n=1 Tax=Metallumcola ferriviriculae TaxID=3039180 RepID=A0AAU0UPQ7_9FIRM|nr:hypothetical protein MFMK1_000974 [Desulfitibacteraceae bacterium MK1]
MEDWVTINKSFINIKEAEKVAQIVKVTESRLSSVPRGPQYDIETKICETDNGWQLKWRKFLVDVDSGCSGCSSCETNHINTDAPSKGKVIEFKPKGS